MNDTGLIFDRLCMAVRHAGIVAKTLQGHVRNEGKEEAQQSEDEPERLQQQRAAKTLIDEVVQEIILLSMAETLDRQNVTLDAEETTPLGALFATENKDLSLVIDPIDGTLEYLEGNDSYSICAALVEKGTMMLVLVFFPVRDVAYAIAPDGKSYKYEAFGTEGTRNAKEISLPQTCDRVIYANSRVHENVIAKLKSGGYEVRDDLQDIVPPDGLISVIEGKATACVFSTRQTRDILIGAVLANAKGGYSSDWRGNPLVWPVRGRIPDAVFGNSMRSITPL